MKRNGCRISIFLLTYAVGISFVWLIDLINFRKATDLLKPKLSNAAKTVYETSSKGKIKVKFKGFGKIENRPTLNFEIINYNSRPAKYWSQYEKTNWSYVKFNGKEKEVFFMRNRYERI
jgi:hypothetical protein